MPVRQDQDTAVSAVAREQSSCTRRWYVAAVDGGDDQIDPVEANRRRVQRVGFCRIHQMNLGQISAVFVDCEQAQPGLADEGDVVAGGGCFGDEREENRPRAADGDGGSAGQAPRGSSAARGGGTGMVRKVWPRTAAVSGSGSSSTVGAQGSTRSGAVMVESSAGAWSRRPPGTVAIRRRRMSSWVALSRPVRSGTASAVAMGIDLSPYR